MVETKSTVYIDADDEITTIIDKVLSAEHNIVALVLPKRASTLQSVVNMKLLKRASASAKKNIVLITNEANLLPLAGLAGLHVATSLNSKPLIPSSPELDKEPLEITQDIQPELKIIDSQKPDETIELDNTEPLDVAAADAVPSEVPKTNKKLKVPNFNRFRLGIIALVAGVILLIILWYVAFFIVPRAEIIVHTDTSSSSAKVVFTASPKAQSVDIEKSIAPAVSRELKKTDAAAAPATGQKDLGTKASGKMYFINCNKDDKLGDISRTIPAGTGVSNGIYTFITQSDTIVQPSGFSGEVCKSDKVSADVVVVAQNAGDAYNLSARSYNVSGLASVTGNGNAMTGGTSKVVKVVSDKDVEAAKQKLIGKSDGVQDELNNKILADGLLGVKETYIAGESTVTIVPKVGEEASEVSVTQSATYSMLGVKQLDLQALVSHEVSKTIKPTEQSIKGYGLDKSIFKLVSRQADGAVQLSLDTVVIIGPDFKSQQVLDEVKGKKKNEASTIVAARKGVKDVTVTLKPFWVSKIPTKDSKITVKLDQKDSSNGQKP